MIPRDAVYRCPIPPAYACQALPQRLRCWTTTLRDILPGCRPTYYHHPPALHTCPPGGRSRVLVRSVTVPRHRAHPHHHHYPPAYPPTPPPTPPGLLTYTFTRLGVQARGACIHRIACCRHTPRPTRTHRRRAHGFYRHITGSSPRMPPIYRTVLQHALRAVLWVDLRVDSLTFFLRMHYRLPASSYILLAFATALPPYLQHLIAYLRFLRHTPAAPSRAGLTSLEPPATITVGAFGVLCELVRGYRTRGSPVWVDVRAFTHYHCVTTSFRLSLSAQPPAYSMLPPRGWTCCTGYSNALSYAFTVISFL